MLSAGCMPCPSCSLSSMLVRKDPETAPLCPQCGDAMRLARKLPPVRPLSGLVVPLMRTVRIRRNRRTRARSPTTEVASTDARRTDIPCSVPALANANDPDMDDQPKTRLICSRCAARMKLARQLSWLDHRLPAVLCFSASTADMSTWSSGPSPRAKRRRETPADASRPKRDRKTYSKAPRRCCIARTTGYGALFLRGFPIPAPLAIPCASIAAAYRKKSVQRNLQQVSRYFHDYLQAHHCAVGYVSATASGRRGRSARESECSPNRPSSFQ